MSKTSRLAGLAARCAIVWGLALGAWAAEPIPTEAFARLPVMERVALSPDGQRLAAFVNRGDETVFVTRAVSGGAMAPLFRTDNKEFSFNWFRWVSNERLVLSLRYPSSRRVGFVRHLDTMETRLVSVRFDGTGLVNVVKPVGLETTLRYALRQDSVIDWMPEDGRHILMELPEEEFSTTPSVFKVNVETGRRTLVHSAHTNVHTWVTDATHRVRVGVRQSGADIEIIACDPDGSNWRKLWRYKVFDKEAVSPVGFGRDPNRLFVVASNHGLDAVFEVDLQDPALALRLRLADDRFDLSGNLLQSPRTGEVVGIRSGVIGDAAAHYWDASYKALAAGIDQALPARSNRLLQVSADESRYLLLSSANGVPDEFYLGDRKSGSLALLARQYPGLDPERLPRKTALTIKARDGLALPAFLTVPLGVEPKGLPLVLLPHGGPLSSDDITFDDWSAFLASRGYAVLQVNFRGSTGHGQALMEAGLRRWGLEMQDDLSDSVKAMVDRGLADPKRVCIVGGSYGGYAALMGGVKTPQLYRCIVAFAPVTDLVALTLHAQTWTSDFHEVLTRMVGSADADEAQLRATSPRFQAERIVAPVLLVHGTADRRVPYEHGEWMAEALRKAGRPVSFVSQEQGDHHLSNQSHRTQFFVELERFLAKHLQ
ncbi:MAG TPA: alpha/beta fold hydrolase [Albitalea sp.]|uniref:alpha/beta hydrolase family protein n=1 Tax=Piscinibacter sp. TaxID=1903157 RepID=UPI002ED3D75B